MSLANQHTSPDHSPSLNGCLKLAHPAPSSVTIFHNWTCFTSDVFGSCSGEELEGLYGQNTLFVSRLRYLVDEKPLRRCLTYVETSNTWFLSSMVSGSGESGNLPEGTLPRGSLGITLHRQVLGGMTDIVRLTNFGSTKRQVQLTLEIGCPILDREKAVEMKTDGRTPVGSGPQRVKRRKHGIELNFKKFFGKRRKTPSRELYRAYRGHPPREGEEVVRGLTLHCDFLEDSAKGNFQFDKGYPGRIHANVVLDPRTHLDLRFCFDLLFDQRWQKAPSRIHALPTIPRRDAAGTELQTSHAGINLIIGQALSDLSSLRIDRLGYSSRGPRPVAAGIPRYIGIFARDSLITGWQSVAFDPSLLHDVIEAIGELQGKGYVPWRDEEPGRLPHERRLNPRSEHGESNRELYYGDVTSTPFYCAALAIYYNWSGDLAFVRRQKKVLRGCCEWILRRLEEGAGFIYYQPAVSVRAGANRNQAWKDSGDAIVDEEGRICIPPLAMIEIQGYAFEALRGAAKLFHLLGDNQFAKILQRKALILKRDFNRKFWDSRSRRYALALKEDGEKRVMVEASNVGHCLATGILDPKHVPRIVKNLMSPQLFSGWGIRTLGASNPAYDPFSYHRGSVWPVENAEIAEELRKAGFQNEAQKIIAAQLVLAMAFPAFRLPEVFTGHARTESEPLPGLYPKANLLQAWSSSAALQFVQALLGLDADIEKKVLKIASHLPDWLDWVELRKLRVGSGTVSLRWERNPRGQIRISILERPHGLRILKSKPRNAR